jgi:hypothetical protein
MPSAVWDEYKQNVGREPKGKRPLGRSRCRWEDNIRIDLREIGRELLTGCIWLRTGTYERGNEFWVP